MADVKSFNRVGEAFLTPGLALNVCSNYNSLYWQVFFSELMTWGEAKLLPDYCPEHKAVYNLLV